MLRNICTAALLAVMLVVLFTGNVWAQTNVQATLNASATIQTALTISTTNLALGNVSASTTVILDPKGVANSYVGAGDSVGTVSIGGSPSTPVIVSWGSPISLTQPSKTPLSLALNVTGDPSNANQATPNKDPLSSGTAVTTNGTGNYYLWVGGQVTTGAQTGLFQGTATFTVEYQ